MDEPELRGRMLGIHLEGPYLSPVEGPRGAHVASRMRPASCDEFERMQEWAGGRIALLTLAPEIPGGLDLIAHVRKRHPTRVALGHHNAARSVIHEAAEAGATLLTHLGNGCSAALPRHDNVIVHQLVHDGLTAGIITDGHHLPADMIRVIVRCKGPERIFVVSDSTPIAGCPPGVYEMMGTTVQLMPSGRIENVGTSYLAGSAFGMAHCMRHLRSLGVLDDRDLWRVGYDNPLAALGVQIPEEVVAPLAAFAFD
jgi:N-acetylglucosamine-6-phosphate deacetylase